MSRSRAERSAASASLAVLLVVCCSVIAACAIVSFERLAVTVWPKEENAIVPTGSSPWIQFPAEPDRGNAQRLFTLSSPNGTHSGDFRWDGSRMYFDPAPPLAPGVRYVLEFRGRVTLEDGESFDADEQVPFFVAHAGGSPSLSSVTPSDGGSAGTTTPLVLSFSTAVDTNSFAREFDLQPGIETVVTWDSSCCRVSVAPREAWATLTTYAWKVTKDLAAPDGTPSGQEYAGRFRVQLDDTAPVVVSIVPAIRSTFTPTGNTLDHIGADDALLIAFSEEVQEDSVLSALTISPATRGTLIRVSPGVFAFTPDGRWAMSRRYDLRIGTSVVDLSGNRLSSPYEATFPSDLTAQSVLSITASSQSWTVFNTMDAKPLAVSVDGTATLEIAFALPFTVDAEVRFLSGLLFEGYFPASLGEPALQSVSWSGGTVLTLTFAGLQKSSAASGSYYKLTLPGGAAASDNGSGFSLKDDVWLYFLADQ